MGFFSDKKSEIKIAPEYPTQTQARKFLAALLGQGVPDIPAAPVAGMTEAERLSQDTLLGVMGGEAFADPRTSPLYQGYRQEMEREEASAISGLGRRAQLGGMLASSPRARAEGDLRRDFATRRLSMLGGLYEQERARDNPYTRMMAAAQYGGLPRQIEQQQMGGEYSALMQELMFPYQQQSQLAGTLSNISPTYYMTQPQQSGFSSALNMASAIAPMIGGFMMGGPAGAAVGAGAGALSGGIGGAVPGSAGMMSRLAGLRFGL